MIGMRGRLVMQDLLLAAGMNVIRVEASVRAAARQSERDDQDEASQATRPHFRSTFALTGQYARCTTDMPT